MQRIKITPYLSDEGFLIRKQVFLDEQNFQEEFDALDAQADHGVIYINDQPVAAGRGFTKPDDESVYVVSRLAVLKNWRGQGLGGRMLAVFEERARSLNINTMELSAQVRALKFYTATGYYPISPSYMDEHCPHIMLRKDLETHNATD